MSCASGRGSGASVGRPREGGREGGRGERGLPLLLLRGSGGGRRQLQFLVSRKALSSPGCGPAVVVTSPGRPEQRCPAPGPTAAGIALHPHPTPGCGSHGDRYRPAVAVTAPTPLRWGSPLKGPAALRIGMWELCCPTGDTGGETRGGGFRSGSTAGSLTPFLAALFSPLFLRTGNESPLSCRCPLPSLRHSSVLLACMTPLSPLPQKVV